MDSNPDDGAEDGSYRGLSPEEARQLYYDLSIAEAYKPGRDPTPAEWEAFKRMMDFCNRYAENVGMYGVREEAEYSSSIPVSFNDEKRWVDFSRYTANRQLQARSQPSGMNPELYYVAGNLAELVRNMPEAADYDSFGCHEGLTPGYPPQQESHFIGQRLDMLAGRGRGLTPQELARFEALGPITPAEKIDFHYALEEL